MDFILTKNKTFNGVMKMMASMFKCHYIRKVL